MGYIIILKMLKGTFGVGDKVSISSAGVSCIWSFDSPPPSQTPLSPLQEVPAPLHSYMGVQDWAAMICQPWERSLPRICLSIVEASRCSQTPNLHNATQLFMIIKGVYHA